MEIADRLADSLTGSVFFPDVAYAAGYGGGGGFTGGDGFSGGGSSGSFTSIPTTFDGWITGLWYAYWGGRNLAPTFGDSYSNLYSILSLIYTSDIASLLYDIYSYLDLYLEEIYFYASQVSGNVSRFISVYEYYTQSIFSIYNAYFAGYETTLGTINTNVSNTYTRLGYMYDALDSIYGILNYMYTGLGTINTNVSNTYTRLGYIDTTLSNIYSFLTDDLFSFLTDDLLSELAELDVGSVYDVLSGIYTRLGVVDSFYGDELIVFDSPSITTILSNIYSFLTDDLLSELAELDFSGGDGSLEVDFSAITDRLDEIVSAVSSDEGSFDFFALLIGAVSVATVVASLADLQDAVSSTFPLGALTMILAVIAVLDADPLAPQWSWDLFGHTVEINLSDFDGMAYLLRCFLFAIYCIGLFQTTKDWLITDRGV